MHYKFILAALVSLSGWTMARSESAPAEIDHSHMDHAHMNHSEMQSPEMEHDAMQMAGLLEITQHPEILQEQPGNPIFPRTTGLIRQWTTGV
jgi:uncharacterized protein involved in copper resistance